MPVYQNFNTSTVDSTFATCHILLCFICILFGFVLVTSFGGGIAVPILQMKNLSESSNVKQCV